MLGCISRDVKEATVTFGPGEAVGSSPRSLQSLPISSQGCPGVPVTLLSELLPLDDERRADNEVWLAFTARALIDPQFRVRHAEIDDALRAASLRAVEMLGLPAGRERRLE